MADKKISALTAATTPLAGTEVLPIVQGGSTVKVAVSNLTAGRAIAANGLTSSANIRTEYASAGNVTTITSNTSSGAGAAAQLYNVNDASRALRIQYSSSGGAGGSAMTNGITTETAQIFTDGNYPIVLGTNVSAALILDTSQNAKLINNLIIGTAGKGIDFSANGGDVLKQYDEGTWTVKLFDAGGGGNQSATTVTGYYTRIGNLVHCAFSGLNNISTAGMTAGNNLYIELPFTAAATGIGTGSFASENIDFNGRSNATPVVTNSAGRAILRAYGSATTSATVLVSNVGANANIDYFSLTYRV